MSEHDSGRGMSLNESARKQARRLACAFVTVPFVGFLTAVVLLWNRGIGWLEVGLFLAMYALTILGVGVGFHRYFTHRAFATNRWMTVALGILGSMAAEGPVLFWAAVHRRHHSHSDREGDPHSPHLHGTGFGNFLRGLWHAHTGWMLSPELTSWGRYIPDLLQDRVVFNVSRFYFAWVFAGLALPALIAGLITHTWLGMFQGFLWGGLVRVFFVHHASWSINSICHISGQRPFENADYSTNNLGIALLSFGEGWHNNHHAFPTSARHGLRWWEIDISGYVIGILEAMGLAWEVKRPSPEMIKQKLKSQPEARPARQDAAVDVGISLEAKGR